ncbi:MAG: sugar phosphate isomerase/epimerase [Oscillospiraceae bacterium]|jgi:sugar phosphate isomerase/epimerase|nr:sugar phosphate isomerase/epimerase [Oscillospiraceae bacterium]
MLTYFGDWPGYNETPFGERYRLIRQAGFDATLVWWGDEDAGDFRTQPEVARRAGLWVENMHASFDLAGHLWEDNLAGQVVFAYYMQCIADCGTYDIPTVVMHTGHGGDYLPPLSEVSLDRLRRMVGRAEELGVNIAIENQCAPEKTERAIEILERFDSPALGMCYDSGHANVHTSLGRGVEMLSRFGRRLTALHLHDNDRTGDQHLLPFDGTVDWPALMGKIAASGYRGPTTLEAGSGYPQLATEEYLARAYERAKRLEALRA